MPSRKLRCVLCLSVLVVLAGCNLPRASSSQLAGLTPTDPSPPVPAPSNTQPIPVTPTQSPARIRVTLETNCRTGPGTAYAAVGNGLQVGETAEVLGRDPGGQFWVIRDPDDPAVLCWVWGQYAILSGDWQVRPVMTPPPTPTPSTGFSFSYRFWGVGPGYQCLLFNVNNTGEVTWESYALSVTDTTHGDTGSLNRDAFIDFDAWCGPTATLQDLTPGETGTASVITHMLHDPSGDHFEAVLTLCSGDGLTGTCLTRTIAFIF